MTHSDPSKPVAPRATQRDNEEDKAMCSDLLGTYRNKLADWETGICESCLNFLIKYPNSSISVKQAKYLDEIYKRYVDSKDKDDPTPKGNPSAQFGTSAQKSGFDDYDDDIPF